MVVSERALQQFAVTSVKSGGQWSGGVQEKVLERCRPPAPVSLRFIRGDAPDQVLAKGLPFAGIRPAQRHGQAEDATLPGRVEHDLAVVAGGQIGPLRSASSRDCSVIADRGLAGRRRPLPALAAGGGHYRWGHPRTEEALQIAATAACNLLKPSVKRRPLTSRSRTSFQNGELGFGDG